MIEDRDSSENKARLLWAGLSGSYYKKLRLCVLTDTGRIVLKTILPEDQAGEAVSALLNATAKAHGAPLCLAIGPKVGPETRSHLAHLNPLEIGNSILDRVEVGSPSTSYEERRSDPFLDSRELAILAALSAIPRIRA